MKRLFFIFFIAFFTASVHAAPARDASIGKLLTLAHAKTLHESVISDTDEMIDSTIKPMMQRQNLSPKQKSLIDSFIVKYKGIVKEELSWQKMMPSYIQIYRDTFTEQEINELIAFYESPTGKMFLTKIPVIMNKTSDLMREKIISIMTRMDSALTETMKEMAKQQ